jgi:hypothetical protein
MTTIEAELRATAQGLYSFGELSVEFDAEMGEWAVWTPADESTDYPGEIIGSGQSMSDALEGAVAQLRQWESA